MERGRETGKRIEEESKGIGRKGKGETEGNRMDLYCMMI